MPNIPGALDFENDSEIAADAPVTESLMTKIGANINELILGYSPIGSCIHSLLTEAEFQAEVGTDNWVIADGRDVTGSRYALLTGQTTIPDMRGRFLRGKNNGISTADGDSLGERSLGSFQRSQIMDHRHSQNPHNHTVTYRRGYTTGGSFAAAGATMPAWFENSDPANSSLSQVIQGTSLTESPEGFVAAGNETGFSSGINESAPRNICVNIFVRIN